MWVAQIVFNISPIGPTTCAIENMIFALEKNAQSSIDDRAKTAIFFGRFANTGLI
jgi:hypothetical protein